MSSNRREFMKMTAATAAIAGTAPAATPAAAQTTAQFKPIKALAFDAYGTLIEVISVEEVKIFKVSPRVYNLGPERMKVTNLELGFISANSWDINGAASAGLNTFWIQRSAVEVPEELGFQASAVVKAITDLAPLLRG